MTDDKYPSTIYSPKLFRQNAPAGFDGVFDWSFTDGCFGNTKIKPMDFDGVVERKGNFLVFESKKSGVPVPEGQQITLESFYRRGGVTLIFIWGKSYPEKWEILYPWIRAKHKPTRMPGVGVESLKIKISSWFEWSNNNRFHQPF